VKRRWICVAVVCTCAAFAGDAHAKWAWNQWSGWFNPSKTVKGAPKQQFDYASDLMAKRRYEEAAKAYLLLVKEYAYSKYAAESQFLAGEAYQRAGSLYEAFLAYEDLLANFPETSQVQETLLREYEIGDAFCDGEKREFAGYDILPGGTAGVMILNKVIEHDAYGEIAQKALMRLGKYYMDTKQFERSADTYARILEEHPESSHFADARYLKALAIYRQIEGPAYDTRPVNKALDQLEDIQKTEGAPLDDVPELIHSVNTTRAKGDYQTARFYLRNGKVAAARIYLESIVKLYPDTEYAEMASQVLDVLPPSEEGTD